MFATNIRVVGAIAVAAWLLPGCGGGGSGSSQPQGNPLTITVSPNPVSASFTQMSLPNVVGIDATVSGKTSASVIYVVVGDSAATFSGVPDITNGGAGQYHAALNVIDTLAIGAHAGILTISLCSDIQCNNLLGRTTVSYTVTVTENPVLTGAWAPGTIQLTAIHGDRQLHWPTNLSVTSAQLVYAQLSDAANVVLSDPSGPVTVFSQISASVSITVSPNVAPGTYSGTLDAVFCADSACTKMYRGVTHLPYTLTVLSMTNLTPLVSMAGAQDWLTIQGSSAHTGYVPVTVNPSNISPRWLWHSVDAATPVFALDTVTSSSKVFTLTTPDTGTSLSPILVAIDEGAGTVAWQQDIPNDQGGGSSALSGGGVTAPATVGGNVFVARRVGTMFPPDQGRIFSFRVADGSPQFAPQAFPSHPGLFGDFYFVKQSAATTFIRGVYLTPRGSSLLLPTIDDQLNKSFVSLDQNTGVSSDPWPNCSATLSQAIIAGTVAVDANQATYLATDSGLLLADTCQTIASSVPVATGLGPTIIPGTADVVAIGHGNLVNFDTAAMQVKWSIPASDSDAFVGSPAVVGSTLYLQNCGRVQVEARDESDGHLLWSWQPPWSDDITFIGNVIATQNLLFVSTWARVYAIDIATHQTVWVYPYSGRLAISSNGILYVNRGSAIYSTDGIAAINLH